MTCELTQRLRPVEEFKSSPAGAFGIRTGDNNCPVFGKIELEKTKMIK